MKKKILMMAMAIISSSVFFTSCGGGDDEPELVGYNGKFTLTEEYRIGVEPNTAIDWITSHIDSLNEVYASLGTDLNDVSSKVREANTDLSLLLRAFNQYIATHDAGENMFYTSYRFKVNNEYPETSEEIRFSYEGGNPRIVTDTITIEATKSFDVSDTLQKDVFFQIKNIKDAKKIAPAGNGHIVKTNTKEYFQTNAFQNIKLGTIEHLSGEIEHEFRFTYVLSKDDKEMIDKFYLIIPIKVTMTDDTEKDINLIVNINIE